MMIAARIAVGLVAAAAALGGLRPVHAAGAGAPLAPAAQTAAEAASKSNGCRSCHTASDASSMHASAAVVLGCSDCHGGDPTVKADGSEARASGEYRELMRRAHVQPRFPEEWHSPSSANPQRSYTLLNRESPEFVRFVNPSDYRAVTEACGACHQAIIDASMHSLHATGAMLLGGAAYNNGILDYKNYLLGESYDRNGVGVSVIGPRAGDAAAALASGILPRLYPLPAFETVAPGDNFRVFERGGRNIGALFPEIGLPDALGSPHRLEEPGRPDLHQSNRGPGTGLRISVPVLNITKTRLNDPLLWFVGTNDQPGDYRQSGCASCHVVYANDRDARHSSIYAVYGRDGKSQTVDPVISRDESGHPLLHAFTRSVPTSQCMVCHMHQPNMFMNSMLGYTMWDYESDAPSMWPARQQYPDDARTRSVLDRNPEGAAPRGKWADVDFLRDVSSLNATLHDTQFADYHGHGWNFRAVYKRDRKGQLLDAKGAIVSNDDPGKFSKAVHLSSSHVDAGMQCVDCHFSQDVHGNGYLYGEVAAAVEIGCKDCHGTVTRYPSLLTSGPAALRGGTDLAVLRTPDGRRRFEWIGGKLLQRSMVDPALEWRVSLVKDSVTPGNAAYNPRAARAKLMGRATKTLEWGTQLSGDALAHRDEDMECYSCHTSWTTSCSGCHLPSESNWKTERHHYEGGETRNYATYNPQVARDDMFMLGRRETAAGGRIAPYRSSSALVLSSTNANREHIYVQQAPISASGFSSQAFNPHYPHTERKTETKTCVDCHLSRDNDNNAIMAQLLMQGTNFVNFVGYNAYVGGAGAVTAVTVTEWDEPQAVIGSYLHRYAYPDGYARHQRLSGVLQRAESHTSGEVRCLQLRGEYLYAAEGVRGMRVYDVASIANKGVSQKIISAPASPLGQRTAIASRNATCVALPTNQPIDPPRNTGEKMRVENQELPFHPLYNYAYVVDAVEGLIITDVRTLADREPRNNFLGRALTWNPDGTLSGARYLTIAGSNIYISTPLEVVVVSIDQPLQPKILARIPMDDPRSTALQFRYLFVTTARGLEVVDVTQPAAPHRIDNNLVAMRDAQRVSVSRTYAYVAAASEGLVIVDVEKPERIREYQRFTAGGELRDVRDVVVGATNASLFAYLADGSGGLKVLQLMSPETQPNFYGFSPEPKPQLIARYATSKPALSLSRGLERDRAVDETGGQIAVFGRRGARALSTEETRRLYLNAQGQPWYVDDKADRTPEQSGGGGR